METFSEKLELGDTMRDRIAPIMILVILNSGRLNDENGIQLATYSEYNQI